MRKAIIDGPAPSGETFRDQSYKFASQFHELVAACLQKDPSKRPSATTLLQVSFCFAVSFSRSHSFSLSLPRRISDFSFFFFFSRALSSRNMPKRQLGPSLPRS
jgi:hypothetical protein